MEFRILGKSGLRVSPVGLGCMGMSHAYGAAADKTEMTRLLADAVEMGYSFFDTAEIYGTPAEPHHNEELIGMALAPWRDRVVIATKCGIRFSGTGHDLMVDSRPHVIRQSLERSLRRLRTDHIDLFYQHRIDPKVDPEVVADTMAGLIREGKILHWGISEANEEYLRRAHAVCPVTAIQNRYSMMARWHESLFPVCEELGVGFVAFSPLANGLLSGCYNERPEFDAASDYRAVMPQYEKESFAKNAALFRLLSTMADKYHATPAQISLAWMMAKRPWIVPIPGSRKLCRIKENLGAADTCLTEEDATRIDHALDTMEMSSVFGGSNIVDSKK